MIDYIKTDNGCFYKVIGKGMIRISREEYYNKKCENENIHTILKKKNNIHKV
jgi:hypothetical protein